MLRPLTSLPLILSVNHHASAGKSTSAPGESRPISSINGQRLWRGPTGLILVQPTRRLGLDLLKLAAAGDKGACTSSKVWISARRA